ncbi:MAG: hypothetical protein ACJAUP_001129 [Cellvibrionaceae bacterium]|jgi:hypothetical protein
MLTIVLVSQLKGAKNLAMHLFLIKDTAEAGLPLENYPHPYRQYDKKKY